jgi:hypothetical protein
LKTTGCPLPILNFSVDVNVLGEHATSVFRTEVRMHVHVLLASYLMLRGTQIFQIAISKF